MSISGYRSTYERLTRDQAALQSKIADETAKAAKLRAESARYRDEAMRTTSRAMQASKTRFAEHKERELANAERRLGSLMKDQARLDGRIGSAHRDLQRAEKADSDRRDREAKRRRHAEMAHARNLTREAARQSAVARYVPESWLDAGSPRPDHEPIATGLGVGPVPPPSQPASPRRRPGRPPGPYLIGSKEEIESAYRELWRDAGRRPSWKEVAIRMGVGERTLRTSRQYYGVDAGRITLARPGE